MIYDLVLSSSFGLLVGLLAGLLPGLSLSTMMILVAPLLITKSLLFCVLFYAAMSSSSQYFGSVTTLIFGVPGENSSIPIIKSRDGLVSNGLMMPAFFLTSLGSFIASILTGLFIWLFLHLFTELVIYLKTYVILGFALLGLFLCIFYSKNKFWISIILVVAGWTVSTIGYDQATNTKFMTFDIPELYSGIPAIPVIIGIWAMPSLIQAVHDIKMNNPVIPQNKNIEKWKLAIQYKWVIIRSSVVGFVSGMIPYIGTGISSFVAHSVECKISDDPLAHVTGSETANNAANLSVLIPLLLLGVAIIQSEFILIDILSAGNKIVTWEAMSSMMLPMTIALICVNVFCFWSSWKIIGIFHEIAKQFRWILIVSAIGLVFSVIFMGTESYSLSLYLTTLVVFSILGYLLRRMDMLPFTYAFLLQNNILDLIYRFKEIYL